MIDRKRPVVEVRIRSSTVNLLKIVILSEAKDLWIPALQANAEVLRFAQDDNI